MAECNQAMSSCNRAYRNCVRAAARNTRAATIMASRALDSRRDRDCMEDLQVYFSAEDQAIVDAAVRVQPVSVAVSDVVISVEPTRLSAGCYTADYTYYFAVTLTVYNADDVATPVAGQAYSTKRCVLYGGQGGVQTFSSGGAFSGSAPVATVQVSAPVFLRACLCPRDDEACCEEAPAQRVFVTLGVFSVISLERPVQIAVPVYRCNVPTAQCATGRAPEEDPCAAFRAMEFPISDFCPTIR